MNDTFNTFNSFGGATFIEPDWEARPMNSQSYYQKAPANVFAQTQGHIGFEHGKYISRTFNRRLKMRDTFTKIYPNYHHEPKTCYQLQGQSYSHKFHPQYDEDENGSVIVKINRNHTHKMDPMKDYNEEMLKLRSFAP